MSRFDVVPNGLDQGFAASVALNIKEAALQDDFMSTNCCSIKGNKSPNQIIV